MCILKLQNRRIESVRSVSMTGLSSNAYTNLTLNNSLIQQFYTPVLLYNSTAQHPSNSIIIQLFNSATLKPIPDPMVGGFAFMDDTRGNSRHVRTVRIILHFDGNSGISVKRVLIFIHLPAVEIVSTIDDSSRVVREDLKQSSIFRIG